MAAKKRQLKTPLSPELRALPARVKLLRSELGLGSTELDRLAGIGQGRVSRIESGDRLEGVRVDALLKIANATGVTLEWLCRGRGPMWVEGLRPKLEAAGES